MDFEPAARVGFVLADLIADFGMEDFSPAAWQATEAGVEHVVQHFANRLIGQPAEPVDFDGSPSL